MLDRLIALDNYHVVLANGQFPVSAMVVELLHKAQAIICCDGAVNKLCEQQIEPDLIIGDCDSIKPSIKKQYSKNIISIPNQDSNDLTKAILYLANKHIHNVVILGATGLREDHALANIALLASYSNLIANVCMISDYGIFTIHKDNDTIATIPLQQVSFFPLHGDVIISCSELKWPLVEFSLNDYFSATLNEALTSAINVKATGKFLLFRAFELKINRS